MSTPITVGQLEVNLVADKENARGEPNPETPFRILIMGDFSGRTNRGVTPSGTQLKNPSPLRVDRDNIDALMAKLGVGLTLPAPGKAASPVPLRFSELADFHPDHLYEHLEVFQALKNTRKCLADPATFAAVAGELKVPPPAEIPVLPKTPEHRAAKNAAPVTGDLLDQIIAQTSGEPPIRSKAPPTQWQSFLQDIVRPHLAPDPYPRQAELMAAVDAATGELMRRVMHHPDFRALEAAWKGLHFLVSRLETDALLKLYLLDISKEELAVDLGSVENLRSSGLYRLLVEQSIETPGAVPWAVLIGNYCFEPRFDEINLLSRIAKIAKASGAPFIAAASDTMICRSALADTPDPDDWQETAMPEGALALQALRNLPEAAYIGLTLPRFLLRLPYGADTEPVETFDFEEISSPLNHESFLWGNPGFVCALLLGQAFSLNGWQLRAVELLDVDNLPVYVYKDNGESTLLPCAEVLLTQRAAEQILDKGLMPLLSFLNRDTIRLARFQAIAAPLTRLAGRWGEGHSI